MTSEIHPLALEQIAQLAYIEERFAPGTTIFAQGDTCDAVYLVRGGAVELSFKDDRNATHILRIAHAGDLLGLPAALGARPYSKSAIATEISVLHRIEVGRFLACVEANPECRLLALIRLNEDTVAIQALFKRLLAAHAA